jgi:hypothetical protein
LHHHIYCIGRFVVVVALEIRRLMLPPEVQEGLVVVAVAPAHLKSLLAVAAVLAAVAAVLIQIVPLFMVVPAVLAAAAVLLMLKQQVIILAAPEVMVGVGVLVA